MSDVGTDAGRTEHLAARWRGLVGQTVVARHRGDEMLRRWAEPHRRYHDLGHLGSVLERVDALVRAEPRTASDVDAVELAAFFHDAVYDPTATDNESRSAALASDVLGQLHLPEQRVREVARLVLLTASHAPGQDDGNGAVLCDADLAVLAAEPAVYASYAAGVRAEYAHVPERHFRAARTRVLAGLLAPEALYRTRSGRAWWEPAARRNLGAELVLLTASAGVAGEPGAGRPPGAG